MRAQPHLVALADQPVAVGIFAASAAGAITGAPVASLIAALPPV
jgi:hypothetical protein